MIQMNRHSISMTFAMDTKEKQIWSSGPGMYPCHGLHVSLMLESAVFYKNDLDTHCDHNSGSHQRGPNCSMLIWTHIRTYPVSPEERKSKWTKLMASKGTKKKQFKGRWIINVICQHIDCLLSTTWKQRVSIKTFRVSHWKKKHKGEKELKYKMVSFRSTERFDGEM